MADIFLSYTEKDREQARRVAAMLESAGWTVWWDRRIPAGETWRSVLDKALENMRCMIVLWSARSIASEWVYEEATEGRRLGKLVPVMLEAVRPPAGFREIQAADLTNWDGTREFEGMRMLLGDLENLLGKPAMAIDTPGAQGERPSSSSQAPYDPADLVGRQPVHSRPGRQLLGLAMAGALLLAAGAIYLGLAGREPTVAKIPGISESTERHPVKSAAPTNVPSTANTPSTTDDKPPKPDTRPSEASATNLPIKPVTAAKPRPIAKASPRCADLLVKIQVGETLSDEAQSVFRKECHQ